MKLEYKKMTDEEFQAVQAMVREKLDETNKFLRQLQWARIDLDNEIEMHATERGLWNAILGVYRFRVIGLAEIRRELEGMRLEINVEKNRRGKR